ncbi:ribonuclease P/MRP protein subunit POP5-like [Mytilus edulis]|uniref:ribonuclease P/MRP protein subunit POP5-like n=1 Tax=Mytilus edulis TaxID=6550 RepID=UPI0039EF897F
MVRFKNRYLVCEVVTDGRKPEFSQMDFLRCLKDTVSKYHGDYGTGSIMTSLFVKYFNPDTGIIIIRVKRGCHLMIQSTLTFMTKVKDCEVMLHTVHIGGTLKSCQKFLIRYHQKQLATSLKQCKTKEEKTVVGKAVKRSDAIVKASNLKKLELNILSDVT